MSYTPGPWKVIVLDGETYINPDRGAQEFALIARVHGANRGQSRGTEHARLIASAPDLLEACFTMLNLERAAIDGACDGLDVAYHYRKLRAAIAKATG